VRKSSEKGLDQEFTSLHNQEEACRNYILSQAFNSWEYYKTYTDGGISGGTMKRPALQEMLEDIKKGQIQCVVSYKVDRLSRSIMDFHNMMMELESHGCSFVSITQAFDTSTSMGKLTLNMLLSFAQFEREVSGERIRDKIAASKKKGLWIGGAPPLGYDVVDMTLVPNKEEAGQVNLIFKKYLELKSLSRLKDYLQENGIRRKKWAAKNGKAMGGGTFKSSTLATLLRSHIYAGRIPYKREKASYPGVHKAIIDKNLFDQVQALMDENQNSYDVSGGRTPYLLTGKIFDENGNQFKNQKTTKSSTRKYLYYALKGQYLPAGDLDEIMLHLVKCLLDSPLHNVLDKGQALEFKSLSFDDLSIKKQNDLIGSMIDKIIYHDSCMTCFIRIEDLSYLRPFKKENYLNTRAIPFGDSGEDVKLYASKDGRHLIIEKDICINNRHLTNKFIGRGKKIINVSEKDNNLIKALAIGWRYHKMEENGLSPRSIAKTEQKTGRTIYRYLRLNYLSPNIVNAIMESQVPSHVNLQALFDIASRYPDFRDQTKAFYGCQ
jgi:DNA invertase Pin-like site-specific DNA recombinase